MGRVVYPPVLIGSNTIAGNLEVTGDLTVSGKTTQVDEQILDRLEVEDDQGNTQIVLDGDNTTPFIRLNDGNELRFGTDDDRQLVWDNANTRLDLKGGDIRFAAITGTPTFGGHDHSESGMSTIPNAALTNPSLTVSGGTNLTGGSGSLGGSVTVDMDTSFSTAVGPEDDVSILFGSDDDFAAFYDSAGDNLVIQDATNTTDMLTVQKQGNNLLLQEQTTIDGAVKIGSEISFNEPGITTNGDDFNIDIGGPAIFFNDGAGTELTLSANDRIEYDSGSRHVFTGNDVEIREQLGGTTLSDPLELATGMDVNGQTLEGLSQLQDQSSNAHITINDGGSTQFDRTVDASDNQIQNNAAESFTVDLSRHTINAGDFVVLKEIPIPAGKQVKVYATSAVESGGGSNVEAVVRNTTDATDVVRSTSGYNTGAPIGSGATGDTIQIRANNTDSTSSHDADVMVRFEIV